MAKPLPSRFNPDLMARDGARFEAEIPLVRFGRLCTLLADVAATPEHGGDDPGLVVQASASFARRKDHMLVSGRLVARYPLQCQRCLAPMQLAVDAPYELVFVEDEAAAQALPDSLDPVVLDDTGQIDAVGLFEDELILHVPLIARHQDVDECAPLPANVATDVDVWHPEGDIAAEGRKNPFDVLKKLDLH